MGELSKIINIGKKLEKQLEMVGVKTFEELKNIVTIDYVLLRVRFKV